MNFQDMVNKVEKCIESYWQNIVAVIIIVILSQFNICILNNTFL